MQSELCLDLGVMCRLVLNEFSAHTQFCLWNGMRCVVGGYDDDWEMFPPESLLKLFTSYLCPREA